MFGSVVYLPVYFQLVQGRSPESSGLMMLPLMGAVTVVSVLAGQAISRVGHYKWFIVSGALLTTVGVLAGTGLGLRTPLPWVVALMTVTGVGLGLCMQPLVLAVQAELPPADFGAGTATGAFLRQLGASLGVAVLGTILTAELGPTSGGSPTAAAVTGAAGDSVRDSFVGSLHIVFAVAGACGVLLTALTLLIPDRPIRLPRPGGPGAVPAPESAAPSHDGRLSGASR
jgi:MFS family permease